MTAAKMETFAEANNLQRVAQELITWNCKFSLIDCLSIIVPRGSKWSRRNRVLKNPRFWSETHRLSNLSRLYQWS